MADAKRRLAEEMVERKKSKRQRQRGRQRGRIKGSTFNKKTGGAPGSDIWWGA